ncbi:M20/M25/M40 family metallo-hydrolase [Candidatus Bipolaricaulota bacterium]|nr:M20/M25/M40 family metallo-hydrolase [Candidatus Bipolaricaulota bacterium]
MDRIPEGLVRLAEELIAFPTTAGREGLCLEYLSERLSRAGLHVTTQPVPGAGENVVASRGEGGPWIVSHLDVFPPYEHPQPFSPRVEGGELIGRGAVDTKGQIAALLWALARTEGPVQVALVVDEEQLGRGSEALEVPPGVLGAVVLEPTGLRVAPAEAGSIGLSVLVAGKAAHGTMPWRGSSAIDLAFALYERLLSLPLMRHSHPLFERGAWVNLGRIQGGYDTMVVPTRCELELDVGFAPGLSAARVFEEVHAALAEAEALQVTDVWDPWETPSDAVIVKLLERAVQAVGLPVGRWGMPSWTDGANLVRKGVPTVVFGAGELAVAHTFHEALPLSELHGLARVLIELIGGRPGPGDDTS